jgi:anthranilate synthase component I
MKYKLITHSKKLLADTLTPVNIYLKLRDVFSGSILLESSDYHGHENSLSFICCDPIASFQVAQDRIEIRYPQQPPVITEVSRGGHVLEALDAFRCSFVAPSVSKYTSAGLFGYMTYDAVRYFEDVQVPFHPGSIPDILYKVYRFVIVVDHFSNELQLFEHRVGSDDQSSMDLEKLEKVIYSNRFSTFSFAMNGQEETNMTDSDFIKSVETGMQHCFRGDVFQIVLSRRFSQAFKGDEFNVYRSLRSINPSPYLFYFDFGSFKIFGSSPEAQIQINDGEAAIYPIAGTFRRSGNDHEDAAIAARLMQDEKENAEHVMLVDLARNDLSRASHDVKVEVFKEIQYYSHVIHLVSKVTGKLDSDTSPLKLATDTFPAGTLSGAPKHMAMNLIQQNEPANRGFYGGAIGFVGFTGEINKAIMIRTFLSKDNRLEFQAGAGIVAKSDPASELREVNNKLEALRKAMVMAEGI